MKERLRKVVRWFRSMKRQEMVMFVFIVLLLIAIATRWGYIKGELTRTWSGRFKSPMEHYESLNGKDSDSLERKEGAEKADSVAKPTPVVDLPIE